MSARISPARRAAFLKAVTETGNQTLAAERAKVSRSWVQLHRSRDPAFDAACREAVGQAREKLRAHGQRKPPSGWGHLDGEELVVRGTNGRRVQIARARIRQWTPRTEKRFLETLAATCNVRAACAAVGLTAEGVYEHRKRWQGFARAWDEALETAAVKIDLAIIESARNIFSDEETDLEQPIRAMSFDQAIQALWLHQKRLWGTGKAPGRARIREPDIEEVRAEVLRKVAAMERAGALSPGQRARGEREWRRRRPSAE